MKRPVIIQFIACLAILTACVDNGDKTKITGRLSGVPDGTEITLLPAATHKSEKPLAQTTVTDGEFVFEQTLEEPRVFYISGKDIRGGLRIMAAPGDEIVIEGTFEEPSATGSELHAEYVRKFLKPRAEMDRRHAEIQARYAAISERLAEARRSGDAAAEAEIQASDQWQAYTKEEQDFFRSFGELFESSVAENTGTFWAPLLILSHTSYLTPENEKHYNMLSDAAKESYYGRLVAEEIFGLSGKAPVFAAQDAEGNRHSLEDLLKGDNYVLVDFWASWCAPCRRFVPTLKELAAKYKDKGLVVVSISTDKDRAAWLEALEEEQMPWLNLLDQDGIADTYGVSGIPSIFLIAPDGELVFSKQSGQSVVDKLAEVFVD